jgi:hypothetical protein
VSIEFVQIAARYPQLLITVQKIRVGKKGNGLQVNTNQQNISEGTSLPKLTLQPNVHQSNIYQPSALQPNAHQTRAPLPKTSQTNSVPATTLSPAVLRTAIQAIALVANVHRENISQGNTQQKDNHEEHEDEEETEGRLEERTRKALSSELLRIENGRWMRGGPNTNS